MAPPKAKAQKMALGDFLADESLGSWADEMDDTPLPSGGSTFSSTFDRRPTGGMNSYGGGSTFERETRGGYAVREPLDLPTEPPYTAHVGNLSFDATADDISELFVECGVTNVRIVEDKMTKAPKGFGYVEFETVAGLQKALDLSGTSLQGRTIRTSVAEPPKDARPEGRELDWSRRGPLAPLPERRIPERSSFGRNMDAGSDAGSERGGRRNNFESDGKPRDFGNWERKGPLSPTGGPVREGGRSAHNDGPGSGFRRSSPGWGEGRSQDGSRPPNNRAERPERAERTPTAADMDNQWRARMRPDQAPKEPSNPPSPSAPGATPTAPTAPSAPASRPKLNLAKRTVSDAVTNAAAAGDSKASPFGAARPIDTAARDRAVEEKRELALRQKKESEEKAKAEKQKQSKDIRVTGTDSNKDSIEPPRGGGNFEILQRVTGDESGVITEKEPEVAAAPAEVSKETNGTWRAAETAPEAVDEDGWSTVGVKPRNNRRGGRA